MHAVLSSMPQVCSDGDERVVAGWEGLARGLAFAQQPAITNQPTNRPGGAVRGGAGRAPNSSARLAGGTAVQVRETGGEEKRDEPSPPDRSLDEEVYKGRCTHVHTSVNLNEVQQTFYLRS